jgi:hypothetical protein
MEHLMSIVIKQRLQWITVANRRRALAGVATAYEGLGSILEEGKLFFLKLPDVVLPTNKWKEGREEEKLGKRDERGRTGSEEGGPPENGRRTEGNKAGQKRLESELWKEDREEGEEFQKEFFISYL